MDENAPPPLIGYAVYPPPHNGMPFLAVTFMPDGTVVARQFETEAGAIAYATEIAKGLRPNSVKH